MRLSCCTSTFSICPHDSESWWPFQSGDAQSRAPDSAGEWDRVALSERRSTPRAVVLRIMRFIEYLAASCRHNPCWGFKAQRLCRLPSDYIPLRAALFLSASAKVPFRWNENSPLQLPLPKSPIAKNAMGRCALLVLRRTSRISCTMFMNVGNAEVRRASSLPSRMPLANSNRRQRHDQQHAHWSCGGRCGSSHGIGPRARHSAGRLRRTERATFGAHQQRRRREDVKKDPGH